MCASDSDLAANAQALRDLMTRLGRVYRQQMGHVLVEFGLTAPQYGVLIVLTRHAQATASGDAGGDVAGLTMSELAEETHQIAATMTGIVDRLAERDLVQRQQDPADRRAWRVLLTEAGRSLVSRVEAQHQAVIVRQLACFPAEDQTSLLRLLRQYLAVMADETGIGIKPEVETIS